MFDLIRDSSLGQLVNKASLGRLLPYADQKPDYVLPDRYRYPVSATNTIHNNASTTTVPKQEGMSAQATRQSSPDPAPTLARNSFMDTKNVPGVTRDAEEGDTLAESIRENVTKEKLDPQLEPSANPFLVDWDGPDDPENPRLYPFSNLLHSTCAHVSFHRNWSLGKRLFIAFSISLLTFSGLFVSSTNQAHMLIYIF